MNVAHARTCPAILFGPCDCGANRRAQLERGQRKSERPVSLSAYAPLPAVPRRAVLACSECLRKSWTREMLDAPCLMPQPDGSVCQGTFALL